MSPGQLSVYSLLDSNDFYDVNSIVPVSQRRKLRIRQVTFPKVPQLSQDCKPLLRNVLS